jgi:hypothetical protein
MANTTYIPYRRFSHTLFRVILVLYGQVTRRTSLVHSMEKKYAELEGYPEEVTSSLTEISTDQRPYL